MELIGVFLVASGLLVLAGVAKAIRPDDTARALVLLAARRNQRVPFFRFARQSVRIGALVETVLGVCAVLFPRTVTAALVAVSYLLFACITVYARTHGGPLSTCGCFGRPDTPPTSLHVVLNVIFVATAVVVALRPPHVSALFPMLEAQPWAGMPLVLVSGVGVWFAYLAFSPLAALQAAQRLAGGPRRAAVNT